MPTRLKIGGLLAVVLLLQLYLGWNYEYSTSREGVARHVVIPTSNALKTRTNQAQGWWDVSGYKDTTTFVKPDLSPFNTLSPGIRSVLSPKAALNSFEEQHPVIAFNGAVNLPKKRPIPFRIICSSAHPGKCMLLKAGCEYRFKIMKSTVAKASRHQKVKTDLPTSRHFETVMKSLGGEVLKDVTAHTVEDACVLLPMLDLSGWDNTNWIGLLASRSLRKLLPMLSPNGWLSTKLPQLSYIGLGHLAWEVSDTQTSRDSLYFDPSYMMLMRSNFEVTQYVDWFDTSIPLIPFATDSSNTSLIESSKRTCLLLIQSKRIAAFQNLATEPDVLVGKGADVERAVFCLVTRGSTFAIHSSFLLKAMAGGCIPVIANDIAVLPLQGWANWTAFSILVREDALQNATATIEQLHQIQRDASLLDSLQQNAITAWKELFQSPAHVIRECLLFWRWRTRVMMSWGEGR